MWRGSVRLLFSRTTAETGGRTEAGKVTGVRVGRGCEEGDTGGKRQVEERAGCKGRMQGNWKETRK